MREGPGTDATVSEKSGLPDELVAEVERAGFYPSLVLDALDVAIAGEEVVSYLVQQETTFDRVEVRRHVTVLSLTPTRLVVAHADDHDPDALSPEPYASASTEAVPLSKVTSVVLSHAVTAPEHHRKGVVPRELSLTIGWGSLTRVDLEPASCADPDCEADHGYTGTLAADDITVRLSAEAEGEPAVQGAKAFARALSAATARV
ncbi:DUF5998 family protein [Kineosporia sp. NBRC 101731]|uniref:DUF5998 family protein n=1 Tax=Kineosporia sp. NBRC 101731 TaxID=3032199 RepID=UPI0024A2F0B8|nr:DUF5998 family protein [Kineosporia sp. NBRC 101731]GLY33289.1 hypothetical protein Kisp02_66540 [Kineosporia sp. NBRC 101731]